jgi:hypothetical protein
MFATLQCLLSAFSVARGAARLCVRALLALPLPAALFGAVRPARCQPDPHCSTSCRFRSAPLSAWPSTWSRPTTASTCTRCAMHLLHSPPPLSSSSLSTHHYSLPAILTLRASVFPAPSVFGARRLSKSWARRSSRSRPSSTRRSMPCEAAG